MALVIAFAAANVLVKPAALVGRVVENFDDIPLRIGDWKGRDLDPGESGRLLPNSSLLNRDYVNLNGHLANLYIVYGLDLADIHRPEYCFEGYGWTLLRSKIVMLRLPSASSHPVRVLLLKDATGLRTVCIYWYFGAGRSEVTLEKQRLDVWKSAFLSRRLPPSALVRITVPVADGESSAERDALSLASGLDESITHIVSRKPRVTRAGMNMEDMYRSRWKATE